jgi:hypothetical protein
MALPMTAIRTLSWTQALRGEPPRKITLTETEEGPYFLEIIEPIPSRDRKVGEPITERLFGDVLGDDLMTDKDSLVATRYFVIGAWAKGRLTSSVTLALEPGQKDEIRQWVLSGPRAAEFAPKRKKGAA